MKPVTRKIPAIVLALCFGVTTATFAVHSQAQVLATGDDLAAFNVFWSEFRRASLARDDGALVHLLPEKVEVLGPLDGMSRKMVSNAQARHLIRKVLSRPSGLDLRNQEQTNAQFMEALAGVTASSQKVSVTPTTARIGAFAFALTGEGWRLQLIYHDAE